LITTGKKDERHGDHQAQDPAHRARPVATRAGFFASTVFGIGRHPRGVNRSTGNHARHTPRKASVE